MTNDELEGLRHEILKRRERGKRGQYSAELRERILRLVREERGRGRPLQKIVSALGTCRGTLDLWLAAERKTLSRLRSVAVVSEKPREASRAFVVRGTGGVSVEGLSLDEVSELFLRLG